MLIIPPNHSFYFNPRTRVGCDCKRRGIAPTPREFQSTHPGGVRQAPGCADCLLDQISIHAPGWGATPRMRQSKIYHCISIHAPGWGATLCSAFEHLKRLDFNPRTRVGCDAGKPKLDGMDEISIHAPGWGATIKSQLQHILPVISIHAPGWGATEVSPEIPTQWVISIHAPGWGATAFSHACRHSRRISIHAPGWGATRTL